MWQDPQGKLENYLKVTNTLQIESLVVAEWNMNNFQEISNYGVYRFRPTEPESVFYRPASSYDPLDEANYYRGSDESVFTFADFLSNDDEPVLFESSDVDRKLYFDLKECFNPFRPRSGINKALYFEEKYIDNLRSAKRPRYYLSSRYDNFKYWNSFRNQVEDGETREVGVSFSSNPENFNNSIGYIIEDTCPFVVYEKLVPTNRIVVKMQTNLSETSLPPIRTKDGTEIPDPFGDRDNSSIPKRWRIEYLDESDNWVVAKSFNENSTRSNGDAIVQYDGYVELAYTPKVPDRFRISFHLVEYLSVPDNVPNAGLSDGESYIVGMGEDSPGEVYIWDAILGRWENFPAEYEFALYETDDTKRIGLLKSLSDPRFFTLNDKRIFTEFAFVKGLRVVVETMNSPNKTFDLIELSPRLRANVSNYVLAFDFNRNITNDAMGMPVGGLLATIGNVSLLNHDGSFTFNNYDDESETGLFVDGTGSLISQYLKENIKFDFYEAVLNVEGFDKYIPLSTMYAESFPPSAGGMNEISVPLRDQFFKIEMTRAPSIFLTDTTLTTAISILLDNVGISNYIFKGIDDIVKLPGSETNGNTFLLEETPVLNRPGWVFTDSSRQTITGPDGQIEDVSDLNSYYASMSDPIVPFFYVNPDDSVGQVLANLSMATQTAMFFDEYNNFVVMPKEYLMPKENQRSTDIVLYGQETLENNGIALPNIMDISDTESVVFNDGTIRYSIKYIQRAYNTLSQALYTDEDRTYTYKPTLLWEAGQNQESRTLNDQSSQSSGYGLGAAALNNDLTSDVPSVENNVIINNVVDLGENVFWLGRLQGYLYANGEIIRYDAIEYDISGTGRVWITSNQQYQKYFSSLPFNGKIYPTGFVRIFSEPFYVTYDGARAVGAEGENVTFKNGPVSRHGRGQFGTEIVEHAAGLSEYWSDDENVRGCVMESKFLFNMEPIGKIQFPAANASDIPVGVNNDLAKKSTRNGIIKNFLRRSYGSDDSIRRLKSTSSGTAQSSALVFTGPSAVATSSASPNVLDDLDPDPNKRIAPLDFISYVYKPLTNAFRHFGTRVRIVGRLEANQKNQSASNSTPYFAVQPNNTSETVNINGGSGGIAIGINPETNYGYYFEIAALSADNIDKYNTFNKDTAQEERVLHNVYFYKIYRSGSSAIPRKLWGGIAQIIIDEGDFVGQDRIGQQAKPTIFDLAVEYENRGNTRRFYLYINNSQVAFVDDPSPLPEYSNLALFVRGSSQCMFENVYALQSLISQNTGETVVNEISDAFGKDEISTTESMRKYSLTGFIKASYLNNISTQHEPKHKIYFEEFGTIMRECAYFNIRYDQAFPALIAQIAPTFNRERGYSVSGFYAGAYGAEFLIFNTTDKAIALDESTGNYLRILGITFTQQISEELSVDDYFKTRSNLSDPLIFDGAIQSPIVQQKIFDNIKNSRSKFGKKEFAIESEYIQSLDQANDLMGWVVDKALRERKIIDLKVFGVPHVQVGDIVKINYDLPDGVPYVDKDKQFVVSSVAAAKIIGDFSMTLRVLEI